MRIALLKTWLNGWNSSRRFKGPWSCCRASLACLEGDPLEHYLECEVLRSVFAMIFPGMPPLKAPALLLPGDVPQEYIPLYASFLFAVHAVLERNRARKGRVGRTAFAYLVHERLRFVSTRWTAARIQMSAQARVFFLSQSTGRRDRLSGNPLAQAAGRGDRLSQATR